jgi:hypothetical protein
MTATTFTGENQDDSQRLTLLAALGYRISPLAALSASVPSLWSWVSPLSPSNTMGTHKTMGEATQAAWSDVTQFSFRMSGLDAKQWDALSHEDRHELIIGAYALWSNEETAAQKSQRFIAELIDSVETLTEAGEQYGYQTMADVILLQQAIANDSCIDVWPSSQIIQLIDDNFRTESGDFWRDTYTNEYNDEDVLVRRGLNYNGDATQVAPKPIAYL